MQYSLGSSSVIEYVARHFAKRAPRPWYSSSRSRRPSRPSVTVSPSASASGFAPWSTLMPGMIALRLEQLRERRAVERALADRLVEEDHAADVLLGARRREEQVAVRAPVLLGRLDPDRVEALLDRAGALVGGEDALAVGDERLRDVVQLVVGHAEPLSGPMSVSPDYRGRGEAVAAKTSQHPGRAPSRGRARPAYRMRVRPPRPHRAFRRSSPPSPVMTM